jgi:hypothetical protein
MPARRIRKTYGSISGALSAKTGSLVRFESALERDLYILLDFAECVATYEEQPVTIGWVDHLGKARLYTPDVLISFKGGTVRFLGRSAMKPWLVEVKYRSYLAKPDPNFRERLLAGIRYAAQSGFYFRVLTERDIRIPSLPNLTFLRRYLHYNLDERSRNAITHAIQTGCCTVSEVLQSMSTDKVQQGRTLPGIWHLIAVGSLSADLDQPLSNATEVALGEV